MSRERSTRPAALALRAAVALSCAGAGWRARTGTTSLGSLALVELGWSADAAAAVDDGQGLVLGLCAVWALLRPGPLVGLLAAALLALEAVAQGLSHERFAELAPFAAAARVAAPLALVLVRSHGTAALWLLRLAVASTFAAHGVEAYERHPAFVDLILAFDLRLGALGLPLGLAEADARSLLVVIALHDFVLAALVVATGWRWVPGWMAVWGGSAALARTLQGGLPLLAETALRAPNALAPLAVLLLAAAASRRDGVDPARPQR